MASRPLPACVDFTFFREPNDVITMRRIVGESSTTKILFVLSSSGICVSRLLLDVTDFRLQGQPHRLDSGERVVKGEVIVRERAEISQK
jgi:hypothetical protein